MAITNNGILLGGAALDEATANGFTDPANTELTTYTHERVENFDIAKSGVQNATAATTFSNLMTALDTALDTEINNDYDAANTVTSSYRVIEITEVGANKWTSAAISYRCKVVIRVNVA